MKRDRGKYEGNARRQLVSQWHVYIQDALLATPRLVNDIAVLDLHKITNERGKYVPVL